MPYYSVNTDLVIQASNSVVAEAEVRVLLTELMYDGHIFGALVASCERTPDAEVEAIRVDR